ncbi:MAG: 1-acyl-sn-glycerol-3-phosphate acyltransferase [Bacteroidales bacterium]|nr:1-acyl-sn-glycerol-3-phosphate acyltransferase [Bacteroidales bacterium]
MAKRAIDQWTWDYWLLQRYVTLCYRIFYRKIFVRNLENIPKDQPVILAANHQNALMDPLAFVCNTPLQPVFLARADIFKGRVLKHFLNYLNIMPIYRIRDGLDNVRKNDEIFGKTLQVFRNKFNPIGIFPEGNHGDKRRLRPLVKGIFRMAFQAQEDYRHQKGVKIVPVGIDYGHYTNFRSTIFVNIGKPIEVSEYYPSGEDDRVKSINALKERLSGEIGKLMIDIRTEEYYDTYMALRTIYNRNMRGHLKIKGNNLSKRFDADKKMIGILDNQLIDDPGKINMIDKLVREYSEKIKLLDIRDWVVKKGKFHWLAEILKALLLVMLSPLFLLGLINNLLPYKIPPYTVKNIKDAQFHSSVKFVVGMLVFPLYYIFMSVLAALIIPGALFSWLYIFMIPLSGIFAYNYIIWWKKLCARFRFIKYSRHNRDKNDFLPKLRKEIINLTDNIVKKYLKSA